MADLVPRQPDADDRAVYNPLCTPCVLDLPHAHPDGLAPLWPCLHCHNRQCHHCDSARQFCSCDCGLHLDLTEGQGHD